MRTHYEVLWVPHDADDEEIRAAYRRFAKIYHPDFNPGDKLAEKVFKEISNAYIVLSDPARRSAYDRQLQRQGKGFFGERALLRRVASIVFSGSSLRRATIFALIGASAVLVPFAAFTYVSSQKTLTKSVVYRPAGWSHEDGTEPAALAPADTDAKAGAGQMASIAGNGSPAEPFRDCPFCPEMVPLKGGYYYADNGDPANTTAMVVKPFALSGFPVTVGEWRQCVAAGACTDTDLPIREDSAPAGNVSFDDAERYAAWLSSLTHRNYRLPSRTEWEFAAQSSEIARYSWGERAPANVANCTRCDEPSAPPEAEATGNLARKLLGFYSMAGGLWQWVSDCWHESGDPLTGENAAATPAECRERMLLGGPWLGGTENTPSSHRDHYRASARVSTHGFRIARSVEESQQVSLAN